jgi:hypothetical protein
LEASELSGKRRKESKATKKLNDQPTGRKVMQAGIYLPITLLTGLAKLNINSVRVITTVSPTH